MRLGAPNSSSGLVSSFYGHECMKAWDIGLRGLPQRDIADG